MKKFILTVMTVTALMGCSTADYQIIENEPVTEIALRSALLESSGTLTRSPFLDVISAGNKLNARVIASETSTFGTVRSNGVMAFNGTTAVTYDPHSMESTASAVTFPPADAFVYLFGLYPSTGWTTPVNGATEFVFTGKEDLMGAAKVQTRQSEVDADNFKTLTFQHLLTKLEVNVFSDAVAIERFGKISSIKLVPVTGSNLVNKLTFNGNTSTDQLLVVTPATASVPSMDFYGMSVNADGSKTYTETALNNASIVLTTNPVLVSYSMVAPVVANRAANNFEYALEIVSQHATKGTSKVNIDLVGSDGNNFTGSTAGRSFTVNVHFQAFDAIRAKAVITDWIDEGEYTGEVEG